MTRRLTLSAVASIALALGACGDDEPIPPLTAPEPEVGSEAPATTTDADPGPPSGQPGDPAPPAPEDKPSGPAESGAGDPRVTELEREAARTVRAYVAALDARDGERACALFAPGTLDGLDPPRPRAGCAATLVASIGYRDPRGLPVWEGAEVARINSVDLDEGTAKVVATVVSRFADRDEASIEDDVVYLTRAGDEWLIAKPTATLYRAIGAEAPPEVLTPP